MSLSLQIKPHHFDIVKNAFKNLKCEVFVFGSRAKKLPCKEFSDLDLMLKGEITKKELIKLREYFEESNLPYKIDIVLFSEIDSNFYNHIKNDLVPLQSET